VSLEKVVVDEPAVEDDYPVLDDRQQRVAKLLACLSEQDRELIYLKYYQEKKNVEIAQLFDMNPSTVATRLRRALIAMRACAEEETS
jgi:RNA polymerase sigma factor (sigma-70 family)